MFTFTSTFMQKKLFYQIDILSPSPILYVYKEKRRPSYLGVILTILMIAITLIFSYNVIIKWINHSNYTITYNKIISQESSIFNLNNTLFAFNSNIIGNDNYLFSINLITVINDNITNCSKIDHEKCSNQKTNFEYKLVSNRKQTFFNDTKTKIHYITLQNLSVEYISNEDIKKLEEESFQKKHNGFILLKLPNNNNKKKNNNRLSLNPNMIFQKRKKRLLSFESKDNENISDIVNNNNNNNVSFQSDFNEIKHLFYKNKSNGSSMKKFSTMDSSNNFDDSCKLEFEILENENDF